MAEWVYEDGIGENRAALIEDGRILEALIETPGLRAGTVADARLTAIAKTGRGNVATQDDGTEVLIGEVAGTTQGAKLRVEITREPLSEPGKPKRAKGRVTNLPLCEGPALATRIGAHRMLGLYEDDALEAAGWSELLEEAASGVVPFRGGTLRIMLTPAMTLIDVDGTGRLDVLALAAAAAAGRAIRRLGIAGNIGIDLPTLSGKVERVAVAEAFDAALPKPFERTAVNGFGFLQIVRPRTCASLLERVQYDAVAAEARALMRRLQRAGDIGETEIEVADDVWAVIEANPGWLDAVSRHRGGAVSLRS